MSQGYEYAVFTARFPFLDSNKGKIRPVIVISKPYGKYKVVGVVPITSKLKNETIDVVLSGMHTSGLVKASVAQVHRLSTLLQADLIAQLGVLSTTDAIELNKALRDYLLL